MQSAVGKVRLERIHQCDCDDTTHSAELWTAHQRARWTDQVQTLSGLPLLSPSHLQQITVVTLTTRAADRLKMLITQLKFYSRLIAQSLHAQENGKKMPPQQMTSYIPYLWQ